MSSPHPRLSADSVARRLRGRRRRDTLFRTLCVAAVVLALGFLAVLFTDIVRKGWSGFFHTFVRVEIALTPEAIGDDPARASYATLVRDALGRAVGSAGEERADRRALGELVASGAPFVVRDLVLADPGVVGTTQAIWLPASDDVDLVVGGTFDRDRHEGDVLPLSSRQLEWLERLEARGDVERRWNGSFFTSGDSRDPAQAGIAAAVVGSFWAMLVTVVLAFPLGVATAIYLEEFAPRGRWWIDLIEVNINNLAAVPSIVFGLLGLAVFLDAFGLPRSAPLVGGLILSLMTLPVVIIAARVAIQSVPPSIRQAAYGLGATPMQVIQHHVLPMAMPGILTGTIIGMARALGETAPLLMIGMVAFIVDVPEGPLDPATALPVQIYLWSDSPERGFVAKTSAAIIVLLAFLIAMNSIAVGLRRRWERRG